MLPEGEGDGRGLSPFSGDVEHRIRLNRLERAAGAGTAHAQAVGSDDRYVTHFRELAQKLEMAIALTYLERWDPRPRNTVSLIDRHGRIVLTCARAHTLDFAKERALTPGDAFRAAALDTAEGVVSIGAMICYGREFPESARVLMLEGAEIILVPNACAPDDARVGQFRARAFENMVGMAMTNYAAPRNNGRSVAFDAVSYDENDGDALDTLIVEAGEDEGVYLAGFDLERIRAYRQRETWGDAYRKLHAYALLTTEQVNDPFSGGTPEGRVRTYSYPATRRAGASHDNRPARGAAEYGRGGQNVPGGGPVHRSASGF